ncbi:G-protein coupled receptor Mth2-like isoform X2 [Monomorium pharaonis]|uniref:G-protein coupled receptor Mth2-like isoform X2 n=1 Tax=Monomorium pharaonis TaxID=307658 RepID=UPI00174650B0|nr:G-protein coupled receptor Mth2-like isoform X2 [Monomorium pharaonis]
MYLPNKIFYCFMLLFVVLTSECQENSTKKDKQMKSLAMRDDLLESSIKYPNNKIKLTRCNSRENFIKNDDEMQYKPDINSTQSNRKNDDDSKQPHEYIRTNCEKSKQMEFDVNSTEINDAMLQEIEYLFKTKNESDSASYEDENSHTNDNIEVIFVPNEECDNVSCIQFCCPFNDTVEDNCVEKGNVYSWNFFFLSTFFWLNVTCFDIWWTFRELCLYQTNVNQNKILIYSIYAWGIPLILSIIFAIMDYLKISNWPETCLEKFWFSDNRVTMLYFIVPVGVTLISNACFFITTAVTIMYQNIRTTKKLRDSESKRHNENKQRFNMYLKLSIVMGISWIWEVITWPFDEDDLPKAITYFFNIINFSQGLIIFITFVCTKRIKRLLLKRFGGLNCGPFDKTYNKSTVSNATDISTSETVIMQEVGPSNQQLNSQTRINSTRSIEI